MGWTTVWWGIQELLDEPAWPQCYAVGTSALVTTVSRQGLMRYNSQQVWDLTQPLASTPEPWGASRLLLLWLWWRGDHARCLPPHAGLRGGATVPRATGEALYIVPMHQSRAIRPEQVSATALGSEAPEPPMGSEENELRKYMEWKSRAVKALEEKLQECEERI